MYRQFLWLNRFSGLRVSRPDENSAQGGDDKGIVMPIRERLLWSKLAFHEPFILKLIIYCHIRGTLRLWRARIVDIGYCGEVFPELRRPQAVLSA